MPDREASKSPQFKVEIKSNAQKELLRLPQDISFRILTKIKALANDPHPGGSIKIQGSAASWRIRVGDYRVVYTIFENELIIEVIRIAHRREVYRS